MRVLLVEDHPVVRFGVSTLLQRTEGVTVVGEAETAEQALELTCDLDPDLVMLDLRLTNDGSGSEVCREIKALNKPPYVLIHSAFNADPQVSLARLAGADGYVHKSVPFERLLDVATRTCTGERVWYLGSGEECEGSGILASPKAASLTSREREVAELMLSRLTNPEIAAKLHISLQTTKNHVSNVLRKLDLKSRRSLRS